MLFTMHAVVIYASVACVSLDAVLFLITEKFKSTHKHSIESCCGMDEAEVSSHHNIISLYLRDTLVMRVPPSRIMHDILISQPQLLLQLYTNKLHPFHWLCTSDYITARATVYYSYTSSTCVSHIMF